MATRWNAKDNTGERIVQGPHPQRVSRWDTTQRIAYPAIVDTPVLPSQSRGAEEESGGGDEGSGLGRLRATRELRDQTGGAKSRTPVFVVRMTGDGKYCMVAGQDRTVRLWNPHRNDPGSEGVVAVRKGDTTVLPPGLLVKSYSGPHGHEIRDIAISPDNARFASVGGDRTAFYWDVATSRVLRRLQGHEARVNCCVLNKDATVLLTGSYDKKIVAWDLRSNSHAPIQTLEGCRDSVTSLAMSSAGHEIVCGSVDGFVRTFDLSSGQCHQDNVHQPVTCIRMSNDGNCVLASCMGSAAKAGGVKRKAGFLTLLEKDSGLELGRYRGHTHVDYTIGCCFSNSDAHVLSGSEDGRVVIWDLVEEQVVGTLEHHRKATCSLAFHPEKDVVVSGSHDGSAVVWT